MADIKRFTVENFADAGDFHHYLRTTQVSAVRIKGPFEVVTECGVLTCEDGYLVADDKGAIYAVPAARFEANHRLLD